MLDFTGKTVWVTGAAQGIGLATAVLFARQGARVLGFDQKLRGDEPDLPFEPIPVDLAAEASVDGAVRKALASTPRLDALVHAAGVMRAGSLDALTAEDMRALLDVNVMGAFHLLKRLVPVFKAQRRGALVTIGSNAAHVPRTHMVGYAASKAALKALCQGVALELAPYGVRCNVISPGSTDTPMQRALWETADDTARVVAGAPDEFRLGIPLGKLAAPEDVAGLALYLASDLAGHVTLQDVVIDGGATLGA